MTGVLGEYHASEVRPPASRHSAAHWSIRSASLTAGIALLLMSVVAIFGNVVVIDGLITEGDATRTAADIMGPRDYSGSVSRAWSSWSPSTSWSHGLLFRVFSPVNRKPLDACRRVALVYSGVFMVAIGQLLGAIRLLSDDSNLASLVQIS